MRYAGLDLLAPVARQQFRALAHDLERDTRFKVFETFRGPIEQLAALRRGVSKAGPFEGAHNYGLAVDFVPWDGRKFVWPDVADPEWDLLGARARSHGLVRPIAWDLPHIEHPVWARVRTLTR